MSKTNLKLIEWVDDFVSNFTSDQFPPFCPEEVEVLNKLTIEKAKRLRVGSDVVFNFSIEDGTLVFTINELRVYYRQKSQSAQKAHSVISAAMEAIGGFPLGIQAVDVTNNLFSYWTTRGHVPYQKTLQLNPLIAIKDSRLSKLVMLHPGADGLMRRFIGEVFIARMDEIEILGRFTFAIHQDGRSRRYDFYNYASLPTPSGYFTDAITSLPLVSMEQNAFLCLPDQWVETAPAALLSNMMYYQALGRYNRDSLKATPMNDIQLGALIAVAPVQIGEDGMIISTASKLLSELYRVPYDGQLLGVQKAGNSRDFIKPIVTRKPALIENRQYRDLPMFLK